MIHAATEQFIPAGVAGVLLTVVLYRFAPQSLWMLPGLWQIVFSLGLFASCRSLPRAMFAAGVWYLAAGLASLAFANGAHAFSPYAMAVPYGVGQFYIADRSLSQHRSARCRRLIRSSGQTGRFAYDGLDRVIHEKARLSVLTSLVAHPKGLVFGDLKQMCGLTDGNLSRHLAGARGGRPDRHREGLRSQPAADHLPDHAGRTPPLSRLSERCWSRWCATRRAPRRRARRRRAFAA